jgi:hypothetical protein
MVLHEHWWRWINGKTSFLDTEFFYPFDKALGFSDVFLTQGLIYSLFRFFGFGLVLGLALRTGVRLPLALELDFWSALAGLGSEGATTTTTSNVWFRAASATKDGIACVVPCGVLTLFDGKDLEAALCLPQQATNSVFSTWGIHLLLPYERK